MNKSKRRTKVISQRDGNKCFYCKKPLVFSWQPAVGLAIRRHGVSSANKILPLGTVDHKIPKSRGGSSDWENLVIACASCNNEKADLTAEEYLNAKVEGRKKNKRTVSSG